MKTRVLGGVPMSVRAGREVSYLWKLFALKRLALWAVAVAFLHALSPLAHATVGNSFTQGVLKYTVLTEDVAAKTGTVSVQVENDPSGGDIFGFGAAVAVTPAATPAVITSLTGELVLPESVVSGEYTYSISALAAKAFDQCTRLTSVIIPSSVLSLDSYAFRGCTRLADFWFQGNPPTLGSDVFKNCPTGATIHYREGATGWGAQYGGLATAVWVLVTEPPVLTWGAIELDSATGAVIAFTLTYSAGSILEWSSNLTDWQPVEGLPTGVSGTQTIRVTFSQGEGSNRFYRLKSTN